MKNKNLYLIPTRKPSRLIQKRITKELKLSLLNNPQLWNNVNLFITSNEEIKEGDYGIYLLDNTINKIQIGVNYSNPKAHKKIILTTDTELIADGVQAIDDDFLHWFIQNPSCEYVEVEYNEYEIFGNKSKNWIDSHSCYEIIIPKEPINPNNQEVMFHQEHQEYFYEDIVDGKIVTVWLGKDYIPKEVGEVTEKGVIGNCEPSGGLNGRKTDIYMTDISLFHKADYVINLQPNQEVTLEEIKKQVALTEARGEKIVKYLDKYKGQSIYNEIALAIEFGYQLREEK